MGLRVPESHHAPPFVCLPTLPSTKSSCHQALESQCSAFPSMPESKSPSAHCRNVKMSCKLCHKTLLIRGTVAEGARASSLRSDIQRWGNPHLQSCHVTSGIASGLNPQTIVLNIWPYDPIEKIDVGEGEDAQHSLSVLLNLTQGGWCSEVPARLSHPCPPPPLQFGCDPRLCLYSQQHLEIGPLSAGPDTDSCRLFLSQASPGMRH